MAGLPTHILTDQCSVFTSKLMKELCKILEVTHLKSSPYHPESNDCLERWHSTLKSALKESLDNQPDWDKPLRQLRGPLDVIHEEGENRMNILP